MEESLALRKTSRIGNQLFIGTHDESDGGILHPLPAGVPPDRPRPAR